MTLALHSVDSRVLSLEHRPHTCAHMHIPRYDWAELIAGQAGVNLGMNFLTIVLGAEGREDQFAIGWDLTQAGHISHGGAIAAYPNDFWHGIAARFAFNFGASGVREVNAVSRFLEKDWSLLVSIRWIGSQSAANVGYGRETETDRELVQYN